MATMWILPTFLNFPLESWKRSNTLSKRQKEFEAAVSKEKSEIFEAKRIKLDYDKLVKK